MEKHYNPDKDGTEFICGRIEMTTDFEEPSTKDILWLGKAVLHTVDDDGKESEVLATLDFARIDTAGSRKRLWLVADRHSDSLERLAVDSPLDEECCYDPHVRAWGGEYTESWVGLLALTTNEKYRNRGYATKLMEEYALPFLSNNSTTLIVGQPSPLLDDDPEKQLKDKARLRRFWTRRMGFVFDEKTKLVHWHTCNKRFLKDPGELSL